MENIITLHENKEAFNDAIRAASEHLGIRDVFVKKEFDFAGEKKSQS